MNSKYIDNKVFEQIDIRIKGMDVGEYDTCRFINCDFSEYDLSGFSFTDCEFSGCNLSLVKLNGTSIRDVKFIGCKMLGLHFDQCNDFGLSFSIKSCSMDHSVFYKKKIKQTIFTNSRLKEVDFSECDLSGSTFDNCDLLGSVFDNTNIEKVDFRSSYNYSIDPEINKMKRAKFSLQGVKGLLNKYNIEIGD